MIGEQKVGGNCGFASALARLLRRASEISWVIVVMSRTDFGPESAAMLVCSRLARQEQVLPRLEAYDLLRSAARGGSVEGRRNARGSE